MKLMITAEDEETKMTYQLAMSVSLEDFKLPQQVFNDRYMKPMAAALRANVLNHNGIDPFLHDHPELANLPKGPFEPLEQAARQSAKDAAIERMRMDSQ